MESCEHKPEFNKRFRQLIVKKTKDEFVFQNFSL